MKCKVVYITIYADRNISTPGVVNTTTLSIPNMSVILGQPCIEMLLIVYVQIFFCTEYFFKKKSKDLPIFYKSITMES